MTKQKYLSQAYRLDDRIEAELNEARRLRQTISIISSPSLEEHHDPNRNTEAPFIKGLERIWELETKINKEIETLVALKEQIRETILRLDDPDERMILWYRYIDGMSLDEVSKRLYIGKTTVWEREKKAIEHIVLPEDAIKM